MEHFPETLRMTSAVVLGLCLAVTALMTWHTTGADLFTSTAKLRQLPLLEEQLLAHVQVCKQSVMPYELQKMNILHRYESFFEQRRRQVETLKRSSETGWHPNDMFHLIKACTSDWPLLLQQMPDFAASVPSLASSLPNSTEMSGACMSLVRLQLVYGLRVEDMYSGNYLGFLGLPLTPDDAAEIGIDAFRHGYNRETQAWLQLAASKARGEIRQGRTTPSPRYKMGQILGLLGRAYMKTGERAKAQEIYNTREPINRLEPDFEQLGIELKAPADPGQPVFEPHIRNYQDKLLPLCRRPKDQRVGKLESFHICRYHSGLFVPYFRYKEEILAFSPFVSIFYDVIFDREVEVLKSTVADKLHDGGVADESGGASVNHDVRTSKLDWVNDVESPVANKLSQRVHALTGLDICQPGCAEPFQVANYGLGGHYHAHYDVFNGFQTEMQKRMGNRLATFLFYLSNVDIGGSTVFLEAKISVAPMKGSALFWYNYDPDLSLNKLTYHAGCPVIKGHKWIANKWIWTFGNTFRRLCGPSPNSTHLEMEHLLYRRI